METKKLYRNIIKISLLLMAIFIVLITIVTQDLTYSIGILYGGTLAIGGFLWIVAMTSKIDGNKNAQAYVTTHYVIRYLIYAGCLLFAIYINLNIFSILIGFICINLSIKYNAYKNGKEED